MFKYNLHYINNKENNYMRQTGIKNESYTMYRNSQDKASFSSKPALSFVEQLKSQEKLNTLSSSTSNGICNPQLTPVNMIALSLLFGSIALPSIQAATIPSAHSEPKINNNPNNFNEVLSNNGTVTQSNSTSSSHSIYADNFSSNSINFTAGSSVLNNDRHKVSSLNLTKENPSLQPEKTKQNGEMSSLNNNDQNLTQMTKKPLKQPIAQMSGDDQLPLDIGHLETIDNLSLKTNNPDEAPTQNDKMNGNVATRVHHRKAKRALRKNSLKAMARHTTPHKTNMFKSKRILAQGNVQRVRRNVMMLPQNAKNTIWKELWKNYISNWLFSQRTTPKPLSAFDKYLCPGPRMGSGSSCGGWRD